VIESCIMAKRLSTREAASKLGVTILTLQRHIAAKTIAAPRVEKLGGVSMRLWTPRDIAKARKVLAGTKPGRKKKA
jgi:excisionase family DNA binding protein